MKKRYLNTIKDVLALKDTDTKIYSDDENDDFYYKFVNGYFCRFDDCGSARFNDTILLTEDEDDERYYILEEEPMQEATKEDVGKLCWFFNDSKEGSDIRKPFVAVLWRIDDDFENPFVDYVTCTHWKHCRRLTPSEVAELTGYKVVKED